MSPRDLHWRSSRHLQVQPIGPYVVDYIGTDQHDQTFDHKSRYKGYHQAQDWRYVISS
jgi:hypothetical protein